MKYHISWLVRAIENYENSNEVHVIDGNTTIEEFLAANISLAELKKLIKLK
jgi:hypothetical protein